MTALDAALWWVGLTTAATGTAGLVAFIIAWSIDSILKLTGFSRALMQAYSRMQLEKMHERQSKGGAA